MLAWRVTRIRRWMGAQLWIGWAGEGRAPDKLACRREVNTLTESLALQLVDAK